MRKFAIALLALSLLCGCAQGETSPDTLRDGVSTEESGAAEPEESAPAQDGGIITITSFDGATFDGKLRMPASGTADRLVIYVNGSGPNTYDNKRSNGTMEFNYHDLFADELTARGVAYFTYNTRGVTPGETPPYFADIDEEAYKLYKPGNQIKDMEYIIRRLQENDALKDAEIYLLGWSEGTFIAPLVAQAGNVRVDALLLAGYMNKTMAETLEWQQTGHSTMVVLRQYYDYDEDGVITKEEYEEDRMQLGGYFGTFDELDANGDGVLEAADIAELQAAVREAVMAAFEGGDDAWIKENYGVYLTSGWYLDFANFPPNSETLPTLELPIHIFHGVYDPNVPVEEVQAIAETFAAAGKKNLTVHIFPDHNHDLNYLQYIMDGTIPQGIRELLDTCIQGA